MARLIYGLNVSLDGYADHDLFNPDPVLFRHFIGQTAAAAGGIFGRRMYEVMRYWDEDDPNWGDDERAFAAVARRQPKWIASRTITAAGPNATTVAGDVEGLARRLKAELQGDVEVGGPELAACLEGLIDEYRLYVHPVVAGGGKPFFAGPRPPLRLTGSERIGPEVIRLTYVPA